jgi:hypothetical protein
MRIVEETKIIDGTFVDDQTFLDADGNPMVIQKSVFDEDPPPPPPPPEPEKRKPFDDFDRKPPDESQVYFDIIRKKAYKWNASTEQFEEDAQETSRIVDLLKDELDVVGKVVGEVLGTQ